MREKGGLVFRFYPFKGWFWFWFFDPVIYSQSSSLLLLVLITCSYYLYVCSVWSKNQGYVCSVWSKSRAFYVFGLVVENFPESQKPVEISELRLLTIQEARGIPRVQPGAQRPLRGREWGG